MDFRLYYKTILCEGSSRVLKNTPRLTQWKNLPPQCVFLPSVPAMVQILTVYGRDIGRQRIYPAFSTLSGVLGLPQGCKWDRIMYS